MVNMRLVANHKRLDIRYDPFVTTLRAFFMGHYFKAIHSKDHKTVMVIMKEMDSSKLAYYE